MKIKEAAIITLEVFILLFAVLVGVIVGGCTQPLLHGYVYNKEYQASWVQYVPAYEGESCFGTGRSEDCEPIYHPGYTVFHPAYWYLDITSCSSLQIDGQCQTGQIEVDQITYLRAQIGSYYN